MLLMQLNKWTFSDIFILTPQVSNPRFSIFANLCRSAVQYFCGTMQICAGLKTNDPLRNTWKHHSDIKRILKMVKTGEKRHLFQNDETVFCSTMHRSLEITDLYRAIQWPIIYYNVSSKRNADSGQATKNFKSPKTSLLEAFSKNKSTN